MNPSFAVIPDSMAYGARLASPVLAVHLEDVGGQEVILVLREFDVSELENELQLLFDTDVQTGLLLPPGVGDEPAQQVDEAVRH